MSGYISKETNWMNFWSKYLWNSTRPVGELVWSFSAGCALAAKLLPFRWPLIGYLMTPNPFRLRSKRQTC
ncbi:MAG: hypothetical protein FWD31_10490, partial [Planctomycetaceae bacterium]|nr:hypothetical protein [Planctomycetaceae bacterium]